MQPARVTTPAEDAFPVHPCVSGQNTILPTAPLSAVERLTTKPVLIDEANGDWGEAMVIVSRVGGRLVERPADGSASLLEAALRARAHAAYDRIMQPGNHARQGGGGDSKTGSAPEPVSYPQSSPSGLTRGPSSEA